MLGRFFAPDLRKFGMRNIDAHVDRQRSWRSIAAILLMSLAAYATQGIAMDDPTTSAPSIPPVEGTKEYYERLTAKYNAETAANEAAKTALASKYPADAVTKPTGIVTFSGDAQPIAEQLALRAGSELGRLVGAKAKLSITPRKDPKVLVTARSDVSALGAERAWFLLETSRRTSSATDATNELTQLWDTAKGRGAQTTMLGSPPFLAADAFLKGAANLLGYFKADFEIKASAVTVEDEVVLSGITSELMGDSIREGWSVPRANSTVITAFDNLKKELFEGAKAASDLKSIEPKLTAAEKAEYTSLLAVLTDHAAFLTSSTQASADGKPGLLQRVISTDQIFDPALTHILYAKFVRAGAMAVTRKHLFQLYPRLTFVGTATISYTLIDAASGTIVISGTGACSWPMHAVLSEIGKNTNQFNTTAIVDHLKCVL